MPVPFPRNQILPARGDFADLNANVSSLGDGEICYAIDQDQYYQKEGSILVSVGATKAQGVLADSAVQPGDGVSTLANDANYITLAEVPADAVSSVNTQTGAVVLDADDIDDTTTVHKFATAAQLNAADSAVQPGDLATVATTGAYSDLSGTPTLGTAAATDSTDYATAAQGATADTALQPASIGVTVQAYDVNNVVSDTAPTFTATVQTTERTITAGAFDLATGNHWTCGAITVPAPTNATAGTSGLIRITAGPVVWNAVFKFPGGSAPVIATFPAVIPFYVESASVILMGNVAEGIA